MKEAGFAVLGGKKKDAFTLGPEDARMSEVLGGLDLRFDASWFSFIWGFQNWSPTMGV